MSIGTLEATIRDTARQRLAARINAAFQGLVVLMPAGFANAQSGVPGQTNGDLARVLRTNLINALSPQAEQEAIDKAIREIQP